MLPAGSLPAAKAYRYSLEDVLPACLAALDGAPNRLGLPRVEHAVVVLVDGLGRSDLLAHRAYARRMLALGRVDVLQSVFPTTTASALASLTTGRSPGTHGIVGYAGVSPTSGGLVNHLTGWGPDLDPATAQRSRTVFEEARDAGVTAVAVGPERYRGSGFTAAVLRGAEYRGGASLADRLGEAARVHAESLRSLCYVYAPELDMATHAAGIDSTAWREALEAVDAAVADAAARWRPGVGVLVTADHGAVDVPRDRHVLVAPELLAGVRLVAGEPRCLALHLDAGVDAGEVRDRWAAVHGRRAWLATRDEVVASGLLGTVDVAVRPLLPDVVVAARGRVAFYVDPEDRGRGMVGQHGSLTDEERAVPLLRLGAFHRA